MPSPLALPYPPPSPPPRLPDLDAETISGWRLHWESDPRDPEVFATGKYRFDAPRPVDEYRVSYMNEDKYACFGEVYGDSREIAPKEADRGLSEMWSTRPLRLLRLDDPLVLPPLEIDFQISTSTEYDRTREWSCAFHRWYPSCDGLTYLGRHSGPHLNHCLFLDRCLHALDFRCVGTLQELRPTVLQAADAWSLAPRLFEPKDRGGWA